MSATRVAAAFFILLLCSIVSRAYSVLTHEEIVDLVWTTEISPLLLKRFPTLTEEQLKEAHGYAYGGSVEFSIAFSRRVIAAYARL